MIIKFIISLLIIYICTYLGIYKAQTYEIRETETALEAWGYTEQEKQEQAKQIRNEEIDNKIKELQIMALPEVLNGNIENIKLYNNVIDGLNKARL